MDCDIVHMKLYACVSVEFKFYSPFIQVSKERGAFPKGFKVFSHNHSNLFSCQTYLTFKHLPMIMCR